MDDFTIKPRDSVSRAAARRPGVSVRTELAPSQSVTAAAASSTPHLSDPPADSGAHEPWIDPRSQQVIDREREVSAQRRRRRAPDQALLRMRAYLRNTASEDQDPDEHADIEA